ncbi:MAG TPA: DUF1800 domain-containing protein [Terracidiphilus sp.]|nr:DUF1800 domain-containing protein [Terracidiphilus sp.]
MRLLQGPVAFLLCGLLMLPVPMLTAQSDSHLVVPSRAKHVREAYTSHEMQGDARILHALNRFTFGPRPGDLGAVRAMGLEKWFDQQLNPKSMNETELDAQLAKFPAMQWSTQELMYRLPSNGMIRRALAGRLDVPQSGIVQAVYRNQMDRLKAKLQAKQGKKDIAAPMTSVQSASMAVVGDSEAVNSADAGAMAQSATAQDESDKAMNAAATTPAIPDDEIRTVLALEPGARVNRLAAMPQPELDAFVKALRPIQKFVLMNGMTPEEREMVAALEGPERLVAAEVIAERLTRDIYSNAQLQEVMTDFWLNHFNIYLRKNQNMPYALAGYARDTIRPHALGRFEDLLEATAHSPAMLMYLDNVSSVGPDSIAVGRIKRIAARRPNLAKKLPEGLNENYARELMELHTVGVNGGYTQADVTQVARILTGWTVEKPEQGGGFTFNPNRHEPGAKTVMGVKYKENGEREGEELLHALASSPATAHFISRELAIRFVSDDPPPKLVDRMAKTYLASDGDIKAVLKTLFHSPEFWSPEMFRAKVKTPLEYVVSAVRTSDADIESLSPLANALHKMGMPLYGCVPPTGYKWDAATWVNSGALVDRMNFALALSANRLPGIRVDWSAEGATQAIQAAGETTPETEEARLESALIPGGVSETTRNAVLEQFRQQYTQSDVAQARQIAMTRRPRWRNVTMSQTERQDRLLAGLLLGSPEFQRR